jgi:hypothetical protein
MIGNFLEIAWLAKCKTAQSQVETRSKDKKGCTLSLGTVYFTNNMLDFGLMTSQNPGLFCLCEICVITVT